MFYPYGERMAKLGRISNMEDKDAKKQALIFFILEEEKLLTDIDKFNLNNGSSPLCRDSEALTSARKALRSIEALESMELPPLTLPPLRS